MLTLRPYPFAFEFDTTSFGAIDDVSVYTIEVRDPSDIMFLIQMTATTLIIQILQMRMVILLQMQAAPII